MKAGFVGYLMNRKLSGVSVNVVATKHGGCA